MGLNGPPSPPVLLEIVVMWKSRRPRFLFDCTWTLALFSNMSASGNLWKSQCARSGRGRLRFDFPAKSSPLSVTLSRRKWILKDKFIMKCGNAGWKDDMNDVANNSESRYGQVIKRCRPKTVNYCQLLRRPTHLLFWISSLGLKRIVWRFEDPLTKAWKGRESFNDPKSVAKV